MAENGCRVREDNTLSTLYNKVKSGQWDISLSQTLVSISHSVTGHSLSLSSGYYDIEDHIMCDQLLELINFFISSQGQQAS